MNKKFKENFSNIYIPEETERKILNMTVNKEKQIKRMPKLAYSILLAIIISFVSCTVVFAASYIKSYILKKTENDGWYQQSFVIENPAINKDIKKFKCEKGMSLTEVEKKIGINFITQNKYNEIIDECIIKEDNEGNLESISITINDYVDYSEENNKIEGYDNDKNSIQGYNKGKHLSLSIDLMTNNASIETKKKFENLNEVGSDIDIYGKEIHINDINTIAYYYCPFGYRETTGCKVGISNVVVIINNVVYTFSGNGVSLDDILKVIR